MDGLLHVLETFFQKQCDRCVIVVVGDGSGGDDSDVVGKRNL